ncbi:DUF4192 domain-containing protein [Streptomyces nitrosporeus]|uniref:DUF4192 domain-containing protein n=1 Tax=Streptomyces nitrosporeus TaxID=28894 RepID=A0A5J6F713_9ACTN|nr:DUF4192 domain-containing protein [Streptomyces nitrosporeus]QEU71846.1 DUF4192 domain-containing protein [Streptomyces nitrosporeus]GGY93745.1 hypothetical protein GCM10010327_25440 [Streptomyces nitrosporeus]
MNKHPESTESTGPSDEQQITLRGPAELADALPYLMGFHPDDSVVMVALHGGRGRFGGRLRMGIPPVPGEWAPVARRLARSLIEGSELRDSRPDAIVVFLCQDPAEGESANQVMERLRPFAQHLRTACGAHDVPVLEALCISGGRYWSYCCPDPRCCPAEGNQLALPGTTVMAAAAAYAGIQVRGTLRDMETRYLPGDPSVTAGQERALDAAGASLVSRILDPEGRRQVSAETLALAGSLIERLGRTPASRPGEADAEDDRLIGHDEAAALILGLQDRETRDRAAEWMEGRDAGAALRLWRALARRCAGPYAEHSAAPLTLAGWVSWSTGDEAGARVALGLALRADPGYTFAQLLHQACNRGLDPETLRRCLREERDLRDRPGEPGDGREEPRGGQAEAGRPMRAAGPRRRAPHRADGHPVPARGGTRRGTARRQEYGTPGPAATGDRHRMRVRRARRPGTRSDR